VPAVRWQLDAMLRALESQRVSADLVEGLKTVLVSFADARERIRTLSHDLRFCVKGTQLGARMQQLAAELEVRARLDATVDVTGPVWTLSDEAATPALYIVAMLALDNVERHAYATRVSVHVVECGHRGEPRSSCACATMGTASRSAPSRIGRMAASDCCTCERRSRRSEDAW
jgi:signal transduction histidine kinase